ncbi:MAG: hypothetical protein U1C96_11680 [Gallionella sp.]|nr:hypothetical protein [Gallionella sp.]
MASLLAGWRAKYYRFKDSAFTPPERDVRATLGALEKIPDDQACNAVRRLDSDTYARIKHAAYLDFRQTNPTGKIPLSTLQIQKAGNGRKVLAISAQRLRELATLALTTSPQNSGGRPRINSLDYLFACALVHYWKNHEPTKPTAQDGSKFMEWVSDMFNRVGRSCEDHTKVLKTAIRDTNKMG